MNIEHEIEKTKNDIEYFENMLKIMPLNTRLGRMSLEASLRVANWKLKKLIKKQNS